MKPNNHSTTINFLFFREVVVQQNRIHLLVFFSLSFFACIINDAQIIYNYENL
jgi:hypothetical protein